MAGAWRLKRLALVAMMAMIAAADIPALAASARLQPVSLQALEGWPGSAMAPALAAFQRSCREILAEASGFRRPSRFGGEPADWHEVCGTALATPPDAAQAFFESYFLAYRVVDPARPAGLFTGYFEPEYPGSRTPSAAYPVPVYARPADLVVFDAQTEALTGLGYGRMVDGAPRAYPSRRAIEAGALAGQGLEIAWMASAVDAFFMHVQGSARLRLPDGSLLRLAYAGKSGRPYTSIGRLLAERAILPRETVSMDTIRAWMAAHPHAARELMAENESFVFFREVPIGDSALGPPGGQLVGLSPGVSLAVDRRYWTYGTPMWLATTVPGDEAGGSRTFRRLMIAQDTGSAIRGAARGDIFFGSGAAAGGPAGRMQAPGELLVLLPRPLALRLELGQP
jgi:membrane-bound lytic murein transglycosylase A